MKNNLRHNAVFLRLFTYLWRPDWSSRLRIIISIVLSLLAIASNVCIPIIFKWVINLLENPHMVSQRTILWILICYGSCWIVNQVIKQAHIIIVFAVLERAIRLFTLEVFDHLHKLSIRFHMDRQTGALTSYIERTRYAFEALFWGLISFLLPAVIEIILASILLTYCYGFVYAGTLAGILGLYVVLNSIVVNTISISRQRYNEQRSQASARIVDSLLNFETVQYFCNEYYEHSTTDTYLEKQEKAGVAYLLIESWVQMAQFVMIGLSLLYVTLTSGNAVYSGIMTVGDFVLINSYLLQFVIPLRHFGHTMQEVRKSMNDMHSILEILATKSEIQDTPQAINIIIDTAEIRFENVCFGYTTDRQIIHTISFAVPAGKTVAIVGPTGSGKSTIARLLFRFYDVDYGTITINGYDIRQLSQYSLRSAIGIVPQETMLFNDTLYYNIAYGNPAASENEVKRAARLAHLDIFIATLPDGYNTLVGERGLKLSGGEKQRVAIARTILKNPKIYIFDEATSSLDMRTEREIQKNLSEISMGITTIIIAHRLSTIVHADQILVVDRGHIVETGTHASLVQDNGLYANLWRAQLSQSAAAHPELVEGFLVKAKKNLCITKKEDI